MIGTSLGPYRIEDTLGQGGMGVVYRATDTQLKRAAAIKVLPAAFATDAERLARFQREAELLASLNHPNIAAVYGLEKSGPVTGLVMELVEGPTLAEVIAGRPMPLADVRAIGRQIARALEAAHASGIVHRDLKPANVKVRPDGTVKVLDFGLAKALDPAAASGASLDSPTITSLAMTAQGVILGTAAYMSPEQARGRAVDRRADIWAFGCVLYEMLTGRRPFVGDDVSETLARVIDREPDWGALPDTVPPVLAMFLRRCLMKDPAERVQDAGDVRLALEGAFEVPAQRAAGLDARATSRWASVWLAVAAALLTALLAWNLQTTAPPRLVTQFEDVMDTSDEFRQMGRAVVAIAPDGRSYVYNTARGLYLRRLDDRRARLVPGTEAALSYPSFSPDGQSIVYWDVASERIKRIPTTGGTAVPLVGASNPDGLRWEPDDSILYAQPDGIWRIAATGGRPARIVEPLPEERLFSPQLLPGANGILFTSKSSRGSWSDTALVVQSLPGGSRTVVLEGGHNGRYVPSGHLIYATPGGNLSAVPFDLAALKVRGDAVNFVSGVRGTQNLFIGVANFAVADDGTLLYLEAVPPKPRTLVWVNRRGVEEPVDAPDSLYRGVRISPDGTRMVIDDSAGSDIWVHSFNSGARTLLTVGDLGGTYPIWLDNQRVAYADGGRVMETPANVSAPTLLIDRPPEARLFTPYFLAPDGAMIVRFEGDTIARFSDGVRDPDWGLSGLNAALSPNGRWMAYDSNESGDFEVYVGPFPAVQGGRVTVSAGGGFQPAWSADGRELFYLQGDRLRPERLVAATVDASGPTFGVTDRRQLLDFRPYRSITVIRGYDVATDGRFLLIKDRPGDDDGSAALTRLVIVQNWLDQLTRLAPAR